MAAPTTPERPGRLPRLVVHVATSVLPQGQARSRYRRELYADLCSLPRARQLTFALGTLAHAWDLRRALTRPVGPTLEPLPRQRLHLTCAVHFGHHWHLEHTDDGSLYRRCTRCGKDDDGTLHAVPGSGYGYGMNVNSSW